MYIETGGKLKNIILQCQQQPCSVSTEKQCVKRKSVVAVKIKSSNKSLDSNI